MTRPTFLSLFSGIGGLDLGLERAGWECVGQVELDPYCNRVLAKHWPDVPRWGDIREVDPHDLPRADLIAGGFPCQPVSLAGQRRGQDDARWLWPELHRIVRVLRPRWGLLENVPGLLVRGMGDVLGDLAASGYDAEWDCIPAAAVGAPHLRYRVLVVAYPQGECGPDESGVPDGAALVGAEPRPSGRAVAGNPPAGVRGLGRAAAGGPPAAPDPNGAVHRHRHDGASAVFAGSPGPYAGSWHALSDADQWRAEPDVGRVAHGVPARLDRLRALGNAVVPQVAELIGRRILTAWESAA